MEGFKKRDFALLALAMDMAIPPLTLLGLLLSLMVFLSALSFSYRRWFCSIDCERSEFWRLLWGNFIVLDKIRA